MFTSIDYEQRFKPTNASHFEFQIPANFQFLIIKTEVAVFYGRWDQRTPCTNQKLIFQFILGIFIIGRERIQVQDRTVLEFVPERTCEYMTGFNFF